MAQQFLNLKHTWQSRFVIKRLSIRHANSTNGETTLHSTDLAQVTSKFVPLGSFVTRSASVRAWSTFSRMKSFLLSKTLGFPSSLFRAFRSPPDRGEGWYFGAIRTSRESAAGPGGFGDQSNRGQQPSSSWRPVRC